MSSSENTGLTLQGMTLPNTFHVLVSVAMVGVSSYLTHYFFEAHFPTSIGGQSSLCDLGQFWNCGGATFSSISHIRGVPISYFGIVVGLLNIFGTIFYSTNMERTLSFISKINFLGCLGLFVFSIVILGSLCPLCTVYYILSLASFILFIRYGVRAIKPSFKLLAIFSFFTLLGALAFSQSYKDSKRKQKKVNVQIVKQFFQLKQYGDPENESPYKLLKHKDGFNQAPVRVSIFSDFQCPFCQMINEQFRQLEQLYPGKLAIQYYFFPLDSECNINVKRRMHPHACKAAYLASCSPRTFKEIHDLLFENQKDINKRFIKSLAKKYNYETCLNDPATKKEVVHSIAESLKYNIQSTPTLIINGVKIEGSVPNDQMMAIFDAILKKEEGN